VVLTAACGSSAAAPEAVADQFQAALASGDGASACALLAAPTADELEKSAGKPCPEAVLDEAQVSGPRVDGSRFGTMAQVRYRDDVVFLTRGGPDGWQVFAASCRPSPGAPYDCEISGG
jgi:hypothetical protein